MGRSVEFVNSVDLLGVPLYADLKVNHIHRNVQKFYCKVNSVLFDFKDIPTQQTMANRFASESDPLNLLSCSNFQPKISSVYVMKVYPSSDT